MHINNLRKYYFINKFDTKNIDKQTFNTGIIYRNYDSKIKDKFGQQFSDSKSIREQHSHTMTIHESELPDGVLFASNKNDVSDAVKICNDFRCR